jgi:DNA modification methylase
VLDPFSGSATTGQVALANARSYVGCELNPDYHELAQQRLDGAQLGLPLTTP